MTQSNYNARSRLQKLEERKNRRQAIIFSLLSLMFFLIIILYGIPAFIRLIGAMGDVRNSKTKPEKNDLIAPVAPTLNTDWEATSSANTKVWGYAEPESKVFLKANGIKSGETIAGNDGSYRFDVMLDVGENEIITYSSDMAGNQGPDSQRLLVYLDNKAPELEITNPEDGAKYYDEREIVVAGTTDTDSSVRINGFIATVDTEGNFTRRIQLNQGENEIKVEASDEAGNKVEKTVIVSHNP